MGNNASTPCTPSAQPQDSDSFIQEWNRKKAANMISAQERRDNLLNKDPTLTGLMGGKKRSKNRSKSMRKSRSKSMSKNRSKSMRKSRSKRRH